MAQQSMDRRYRKKMDAYWSREERKAVSTVENAAGSAWFNYWHTHPDWSGKGNRSIEDRVSVARISIRLLGLLDEALSQRELETQCWVMLCADTAYDSVYVHSPNPYDTAFPYVFLDIRWGQVAPEWLLGIVPAERYEVGVGVREDQPCYFIRPRG
nr:hypothetical protein SrhCFBP13529_16305 [Stenotrophomonas rhizophila]